MLQIVVSWPSVVRSNWTRVVLFRCILGCLLFLICIEFVCLYFPVLFCLSVPVKWLTVKTASEMTYTVSSGALNSSPSNDCRKFLATPLLEPALCQLYRHTFVPYEVTAEREARVFANRCSGRGTALGVATAGRWVRVQRTGNWANPMWRREPGRIAAGPSRTRLRIWRCGDENGSLARFAGARRDAVSSIGTITHLQGASTK